MVQGRPPCVALPGYVRSNAVSLPLNFLTLSVLVSVVQGVLQPVSRVLGFSQSYLVHK